MDYKIGEFVLIKDDNYIAKKFIGEILSKVKNDYRIYVYNFPEDTIDGRKPYMSSNEVFLTTTRALYYLSGIDEQKVEVVSMDQYINKKYINNEKLDIPLYFYRQTYIIEENKFNPEILPRICYCQEIFNPDIPFKRCVCGNFFHPDCLLQTKSSKCWADNCNYNCDSLLSEAEQFQKTKIVSGELKESNIEELQKVYNNEMEMLILREKLIQDEKEKEEEERMQKEKEEEEKIEEKEKKENHVTNIHKDNSDSSIDSSDSRDSYNEKKYDKINVLDNIKRMNLLNQLENEEIKFFREKGRILIFDIFKRCLILIKNDLGFLEKYKKYKKKKFYKLIQKKDFSRAQYIIKKISENEEENLYNIYSFHLSTYSNIIKKFNEINNNNYNFLIKVIFDEYTLDEINNYKNEDLLKKDVKEVEEKNENKINIFDDIKNENIKFEINSDNIEKLIFNQKLDGTWEANEDNMKYLNIGYKDLDDFKNKNKNILDELFGEEKMKEINDDLLMTIIIICIFEQIDHDKEKIISSFEIAFENIKKNINIFNKEFIKKFIDKLFINNKGS